MDHSSNKSSCSALRYLPEEERPRERLLRDGIDALSLAELLAIVLGTGTKGKSVLSLAHELISRFRDLSRLLDATVEELMQVKGIGKAKAITLRAVFGIARKNDRNAPALFEKIKTADQAFQIARHQIAYEKNEMLLVILRDVRGRLVHFEKVSSGTLSEVLVHPREVFYPAVRHKAHSLIVAHNHPSGDPTPSTADLNLTRVLIGSSRIMGIAVDDHLIVTKNNYVSLRERGYMGKDMRSY